jgi:transposase
MVNSLRCHEVRAVLNTRALLVKIKRDLGNQIRGLLKNLGLIIGNAQGNVFARRVEELVAEHPYLLQAVRPLLVVRERVSREIADLDRKLLSLAREHQDRRHLMPVPGVGPITALAFQAAIDEPSALRPLQERRGLFRPDAPSPCLRRDRLDGANLQMR